MSPEARSAKISSNLIDEDYIAFCGLSKVATQSNSGNRQIDVEVSHLLDMCMCATLPS
jgi:hypothetical protein